MSKFVSGLALLIYVILCLGALAWWSPHFYRVNPHLLPRLDYRYIMATGIPLGLFLITAIGRQAMDDRFSSWVALQVALVLAVFRLGLMTFYYPPEANFFCPLDLALCALFLLINLNWIRRFLKRQQVQRKTLAAA